MKLSIHSCSHPLQLGSAVPEDFPGLRLPGGEVLFADTGAGGICLQEFDGGNFTVRYSVGQTEEPVELRVQSHHSGLHAIIMLRNTLTPVFPSGDFVSIGQEQFTLVHAREPQAAVSLPAGQPFACFELLMADEFMQAVLRDFPSLPESLLRSGANEPRIWINPPKWADEEVREHIRYILNYSEAERWRRGYFERRVTDIVWRLVLLHLRQPAGAVSMVKADRDTAYELQRMVLENLSKHEAIKDMAKKVGVCESKLKQAFRGVFGMGVNTYRKSKRLQKAVRLMHDGKSVKEAAAAVGWHSYNLINAYRKAYGTTPGAACRKR